MLMRKVTLVAACLLLIMGACKTKQGTVSTNAFYDMTPAFQSSDPSGRDYFRTYAKGQNDKECKNNAKIAVMRMLVYDGVRQGASFTPILNDPAQVAKFRAGEQAFFSRQLLNTQVVDVQKVIEKDDKLRQSEAGNSVLSMQVIVAVDRNQLTKEVMNAVN
jgi:hypothetical protein